MAAQAGRPRHEARLRSAAGEHAGSWLAVFPLTRWTTARGRDYQLALCLRLGAVLPELAPVRGVRVRCGGCTEELDEFGFHPVGYSAVALREQKNRHLLAASRVCR